MDARHVEAMLLPTRTRCFFLALAPILAFVAGVWLTRTSVSELDITTGAFRTRTVIYGVTVNIRPEPTWMSRVLAGTASQPPRWRTVSRRGLLHRARVNHRWARVLGDIRLLTEARSLVPLSPEADALVAEGIVDRWTAAEDPEAASMFIDEVFRAMMDKGIYLTPGQSLSPTDLGL
ncbi:MAG: hypothetical protein R3B68_05815 [Phycisphaerales bacterium]